MPLWGPPGKDLMDSPRPPNYGPFCSPFLHLYDDHVLPCRAAQLTQIWHQEAEDQGTVKLSSYCLLWYDHPAISKISEMKPLSSSPFPLNCSLPPSHGSLPFSPWIDFS